MDLLSCSEFTETMNSFDWFTVSSTSERGIKALLSSSFDPYSPDDQMQWSWTVVWNLQPIEKWIHKSVPTYCPDRCILLRLV